MPLEIPMVLVTNAAVLVVLIEIKVILVVIPLPIPRFTKELDAFVPPVPPRESGTGVPLAIACKLEL